MIDNNKSTSLTPICLPREVDYNYFVKHFEILFTEQTDINIRNNLISRAGNILFNLNNESKTSVFIEHFSNNFNLDPSLFADIINNLKSQNTKNPDSSALLPAKLPLSEEILTNPVNQDVFNEINFSIFDFYIQDNVYYTKSFNKQGKIIINRESNFLMEILFHFNDSTNNTKRLIKIQHHTGTINLVEILSSEMGTDKFETILKSHKCSFFGYGNLLKKIFAALMDHEIEAIYLNDMGYNPLLNIYVFANTIIFEDNTFTQVNNHGIILHQNNCYYLPAFSSSNISNKNYADMRRFVFRPGNFHFKEYTVLMKQTFGLKSIIGISFLISCLFRDIIIKETKFFPYLFLFGEAGTGKSTFIGNLTGVFGEHDPGCPISNSTAKYLGRVMSQKKNTLVYLKEWDNSVGFHIINLLKNTYDGISYGIANSTGDKTTTSYLVENGVIIDGNELPTINQAVFDRNIILDFFQSKYTESEVSGHQKLIDENNIGLGYVLLDVLKNRDYFRDQYKDTYREILIKVKNDLSIILSNNDLMERIAKHTAFLYTPIKILYDKLDWSFSDNEFEDLISKLYTDAIDKLDILNEISPVNIFWAAMTFERSKEFPTIIPDYHYIKDDSECILYLKLKEVMPYYLHYCNNNNIKGNTSTMKKLLLHEPYFIPGDIKGRGISYTKKNFGSCYRFNYKISEHDPDKIIINNNELNL